MSLGRSTSMGGSVLTLLLLLSPRAYGSGAEDLFAEGKALIAEGRTEEGCAKLAESEKLEHGLGVRFQLAMCREQMGRTASAWAGYLAVASEARPESDRFELGFRNGPAFAVFARAGQPEDADPGGAPVNRRKGTAEHGSLTA